MGDAYTQGQADARGLRRPERRTDPNPDGARVITLPFARLLEPPASLVQAEERVRLERRLFDQRAEHAYPDESGARPESEARPEPAPEQEPDSAGEPEEGPARRPEAERGQGPEQEAGAGPSATPERRPRRAAQPVRKVVRGKGGRPIVPPLTSVPAQDRRGGEPADPDARARARGRRLSDRAKALEQELGVEQAREVPPEPAP
ncbi:hypothetical protein VO63_14705 [Streptomyces showdoensis]|uniref:Uncharacterized protein n=1 Tax=Streptomyces showdoensis TaxID=68268 RepID=A0A2P2GNF0_STREW|nr:hypothetical protein VO63_14705 [Streptomyces showdoensis]